MTQDSLSRLANPERGVEIFTVLAEEVKASGDPLVTMLIIELEPGAPGSPPHLHPGPVFGYVLEGELRFQCEGHPEHRYRAGDVFWEPGEPLVHVVSANASDTERTRFLAVCVGRRGAPPLIPVER